MLGFPQIILPIAALLAFIALVGMGIFRPSKWTPQMAASYSRTIVAITIILSLLTVVVTLILMTGAASDKVILGFFSTVSGIGGFVGGRTTAPRSTQSSRQSRSRTTPPTTNNTEGNSSAPKPQSGQPATEPRKSPRAAQATDKETPKEQSARDG
jgi:hypothetical protein